MTPTASSTLPIKSLPLLALPLLIACPATAIEIGRDDFNTNLNGQVGSDPTQSNFLSRTLSPDNSNNLGFRDSPGVFGTNVSSFFDIFGITTRDVLFDVADDSAGIFPDDVFGIVGASDTDGLVVLADTTNGNNPSGQVSIVWTFDVSGYKDLSVSLDAAAQGVFEVADVLTLRGSLDGGPTQLLMDVQYAPETGSSPNCVTCYTVTLESGASYTNYGDLFFDGVAWDEWANQPVPFALPDPGPAFFASNGQRIIGFTDLDANGDGLAELEDGTTTRAYKEALSTFTVDTQEFNLFKQPLVINPQSDNVALDNNFQTFTFPVSGVGDVLTLTFDGVTNGSLEFVAFDNLVIEGIRIPEPSAVCLVAAAAALLTRRRSP